MTASLLRRNGMLLALGVGALLTVATPALPADVSDDAILQSLNKGADYLLAQRKGKDKDNWEEGEMSEFADQTGGLSSVILYALLQVGESTKNPRLAPTSQDLAPAIKWVSSVSPAGTYTASYQLMALAPLYKNNPDVRKAANRARDYLLTAVYPDGSYGYRRRQDKDPSKRGWLPADFWDNSNSQIAVLAMWYAEDNKIEVPEAYWKLVDRHWRTKQDKSGAWCYHDTPPILDPKWTDISPSMTAAGLATLYITRDRLDDGLRLEPKIDRGLDAGLAWLTKNYGATIGNNNLYYHYAIERVGLTTGMKHFGTTPWFSTQAAELLRTQQADGSWNSGMGDNKPTTLHTAFAMKFLARGRNPIMFNKLQYPNRNPKVASRWNARLEDDAHLTRWLHREFETPLNWQVVNLQVPPEEWLDAPILLITGSIDPEFTKEDLAKLKAYIQAGGLIFSTSDGKSAAFTKAMRKYAAEVLDGKYDEMRTLPNTHLLYKMDTARKLDNLTILGMSNGVREVWIHSPEDLGAAWQRNSFAEKTAWDFPANLCTYATGKSGFRQKLRDLIVKPGSGPINHKIALARLDFAGNSDPEPAAWPRLAKIAQRDFATQLTLSTVNIADLDFAKTPLAHITGTGAFTLGDPQIAALKTFLQKGGTLIADAAGGDEKFGASFLALTAALYPKNSLTTIPLEDEIYAGKIPDTVPITEIAFRRYYIEQQSRQFRPKIQGLKIADRYTVIFSGEDLTSGFLGTHTWGILGYTPESAQALIRNILLYASTPRPAAAQPTTAPAASPQ